MPDAAALRADLSERRGAEVDSVHGDDGRAFRAAIAFERTNAEVILERNGHALRQFFRAGHDEAQTAEFFGSAAAQVGVEECRSGEEHGYGILADQGANDTRIER